MSTAASPSEVGQPLQLTPEQYEQIAKAYLTSKSSYSLVPLVVGGGVDLLLCGMMIAMMVQWARKTRDQRWLKVVVWWVFVAELGHSVYTFGSIIRWFGVGFGTYLQFTDPTWIVWHGLFSLLVVPPVLIFYFLRVYRLERRCIWLSILLAPLLLAWSAGCVGVLVVSFSGDHTELTQGMVLKDLGLDFARIVDGTTLGLDLIITGAMTFVLYRTRTGWSGTDRLVNRLIFITVETLLPSTLLAAAGLTTEFALKQSFLLVMYSMIYSKSVALTFLAVLLGRKGLRHRYISPATTLPPTLVLAPSPPDVSQVHVHGSWKSEDSSTQTRDDYAGLGSPRETDDLHTPRDEVYSLQYADTFRGANKDEAGEERVMELSYASAGRASSALSRPRA